MTNRLMNAEQVAERLGRSVKAIYSMRQAGKGPKSALLAGRLVWRETDVEKWIDAAFEGNE